MTRFKSLGLAPIDDGLMDADDGCQADPSLETRIKSCSISHQSGVWRLPLASPNAKAQVPVNRCLTRLGPLVSASHSGVSMPREVGNAFDAAARCPTPCAERIHSISHQIQQGPGEKIRHGFFEAVHLTAQSQFKFPLAACIRLRKTCRASYRK
jgi:hypothetical protein